MAGDTQLRKGPGSPAGVHLSGGERVGSPQRPYGPASETDSLAIVAWNLTTAKETRTLNGRHHCPFEVGVDVYVLGLLRGHGRRGHHHPGGLDLGRHVHPLRRGGVVRVLQGQQGLELLLLEQTADRLLRRWRRRRLRLWRRN